MNRRRAPQTWGRKFQVAFHGIGVAVAIERSFRVHLPLAFAALVMAAIFQFDAIRWCLLLLCISGVLSTELLNSAIERLAQAIDCKLAESPPETHRDDEQIRDALDMASGSVLVFSILAAVIGAILFLPELILGLGLVG